MYHHVELMHMQVYYNSLTYAELWRLNLFRLNKSSHYLISNEKNLMKLKLIDHFGGGHTCNEFTCSIYDLCAEMAAMSHEINRKR